MQLLTGTKCSSAFASHWFSSACAPISFVELPETLPVHGPSSEYTDSLLLEDFAAMLDKKERHIVVCLRSGITRLGDIASSLRHANRSPISKALVPIRKKTDELGN